jgi:branched-chain amino acid transport system permease protein
MTNVDTRLETGDAASFAARVGPFVLDRRHVINYAVLAAVLAAGLFAIPGILSVFWVKVFTQVAYYAIVAAGLVLLYGRVGLASLGQVALVGVGSWVCTRLYYATGWPFPILLVIAGLTTAVIGVLIGLPALRLRGLYLALVTLMAAAAFNIVILTLKFPNGGPGFKGLVKDQQNRKTMGRPSIAHGDLAYLRYVIVIAAIMFALYAAHLVSKPGRAWASISQSEPAALAGGVNTTVYKLWAFGLVSFATGVAGGLLAADVGSPSSVNSPAEQSLILMAVVVMAGYTSLWGGVIAALLARFLPEFLKDRGVSDRIGFILFGIGLLVNLVLSTRAMKKKGLIS